jgi:MFS family permease
LTQARLRNATLLATAMLTVMASAGLAPVLPMLRAHFAGTPGVDVQVRLVLALPALGIALWSPVAGLLADRMGRLRVLIGSLALYAVAGTAGLWVDSLAAVLVGRALLGVAVGGVMTAGTALIADYFDGAERTRFLGLQAAFMGFGGVLFLVLGGALAGLGWRGPFAVYGVALVVLPAALVTLREPPLARVDLGPSWPEPHPWPTLLRVYGLVFAGQVVFYLIPAQTPYLLALRHGADPIRTALVIGGAATLSATVSLRYARLRARMGFVQLAALSFAVMGAGYLLIATGAGMATALGGLALAGAGAGIILPNATVWLTTAVTPSLRGRALGALTTAIFLGQFVSPIAAEAIRADDPHAVFLWAGVLSLVLGASTCALTRAWAALPRPARGPMESTVTAAPSVETR